MEPQRGSDKHSPEVDDELKQETRGLEQGAPVEPRAEEWRAAEPEGDDQRDVAAAPRGGLTGEQPTGMDSGDVEGRSELAQTLRPSVFPADRAALLAEARETHATDGIVAMLGRLPAGVAFTTVAEVWEALGGGHEQGRE